VALYARVSTTDQTCALQPDELRAYVARRGWEIHAEYVDTGWSGGKASRPQLDLLMDHARRRKFDAVLVWKLESGILTMQGLTSTSTGGMLLTNPPTGALMLLSPYVVSKMLNSPRGIRALTQGLHVPLGSPAAASIAASKILSIAGQDAKVIEMPKADKAIRRAS
jgi:hypothetical protein